MCVCTHTHSLVQTHDTHTIDGKHMGTLKYQLRTITNIDVGYIVCGVIELDTFFCSLSFSMCASVCERNTQTLTNAPNM